ncbi:MAG TPA: hypothetical protein VLK65_04525 [Vicinamibacteria bacterium]|nr:hypothetical protein [Vicinamibacteria bacterium]
METHILDAIARGWENFVARPEGPLNIRFLLQPAMAIGIAVRAGLKDAREGRPAYLWEVFTNPAHRRDLLQVGWRDGRRLFLFSVILDAIYQIIVHRYIYVLELLFTAALLALAPYFVLRGPVNRLARLMSRGHRAD